MSAQLLDHIIDTKHLDSIPAEDVRSVQGMITAAHGGGPGSAHLPAGKRWLHEIVANGRNGIDVDKFDYLARDSLYCGVKLACDWGRIMQFSKAGGISAARTQHARTHACAHARMHACVPRAAVRSARGAVGGGESRCVPNPHAASRLNPARSATRRSSTTRSATSTPST